MTKKIDFALVFAILCKNIMDIQLRMCMNKYIHMYICHMGKHFCMETLFGNSLKNMWMCILTYVHSMYYIRTSVLRKFAVYKYCETAYLYTYIHKRISIRAQIKKKIHLIYSICTFPYA